MIGNLAWYLSACVRFDCDLENITARLSVESFVITSLNHKLYWFPYGLFFEKTRAEAERLESTSVHEVSEWHEGCCKFVAEN